MAIGVALGLAIILPCACILPDTGIQILTGCGELWVAETAGAYGYNATNQKIFIKTDSDGWIAKSYCVTEQQHQELDDITSDLAADLVGDIYDRCLQRAADLNIQDVDQTCAENATIGYAGECKVAACDDAGSDDELGTEDGADPTNVNTGLSMESLTLTAEVRLEYGEYIVSQHLIDTVTTDLVGLGNDGTSATQIEDATGTPFGFRIDGVTAGNLGGVLGLHDDDVVTSVSGHPTVSYDDLLTTASILRHADTASLTIDRYGTTIVLNYIRGE